MSQWHGRSSMNIMRLKWAERLNNIEDHLFRCVCVCVCDKSIDTGQSTTKHIFRLKWFLMRNRVHWNKLSIDYDFDECSMIFIIAPKISGVLYILHWFLYYYFFSFRNRDDRIHFVLPIVEIMPFTPHLFFFTLPIDGQLNFIMILKKKNLIFYFWV